MTDIMKDVENLLFTEAGKALLAEASLHVSEDVFADKKKENEFNQLMFILREIFSKMTPATQLMMSSFIFCQSFLAQKEWIEKTLREAVKRTPEEMLETVKKASDIMKNAIGSDSKKVDTKNSNA
jgi:hypothetical protein